LFTESHLWEDSVDPIMHSELAKVHWCNAPCSFSGKGYYVDGTAIFGSLVLLIILLALTLERILGLDRFINQAIQ